MNGVEFGGGFGDDVVKPGKQDIAKTCGIAGFGILLIREELLQRIELGLGGDGFEIVDGRVCGRCGLLNARGFGTAWRHG